MAPEGGSIRYIVVSPVRNESEYLERTIQSVVNQTLRPAQWILVDDGSTDGTPDIIRRWADKCSWILPVHRHSVGRPSAGSLPLTPRTHRERQSSRGKRAFDAKEIEAFLDGYTRVTSDWEFLVKLDGDVSFQPSYFEDCFREFSTDPGLGIGGGVVCHQFKGELRVEPIPQFHVRGATKIYRRMCWEQIGGVVRGAGWDTIDEVKANMLGWSTRSFPDIKVVHHRHTGSANGAWRNAVKNGNWSYVSGYHPLYMLARFTNRLLKKPFVVGSVGLLWGFLLGYVRNTPQIDDRKLIRYLRGQQLRRLFHLNTIWK
jgi:poly-beta-1,6-N-acetyl-D-glucosamine synthase